MTTPRGKLYLGGHLEAGKRTGAPLHYDRHHLTTHGVIVGMTGSGKTGLGVVLLEEVLRQGVPALIIDPKGDMGNLLLGFPELKPKDFEPWVDAGEAQRKDVSVAQLSETTSEKWRKGLEGWQLGGEAITELHEAADFKIWTPGSTAGTPMNVVGSLQAPDGDFDADPEVLRAEIESFVSSLLLLADIDADPISSREHILLCHLIEKSWRVGRDLELGQLIMQVANPPIRRLGVFELDEFFPAKQRGKLAMRLNGLVASPSFATWMQGEALDVDSLLFTPEGGPRASVIYLPHLGEEQRQFVVTLLLSKVVTWMRKQPGTSDLRALIYMDEVYGFAPPTRNPPSKKPILTLLKQARAHGVGLVLSTQNPVDLDYKAMSNAGTWVIGRLSTERDKARILEALKSAAGNNDVKALDTLIGGLGKRHFIMIGARQPQPAVFTTRWALSFLRGPLTRDEVRRLCGDVASTPARGVATKNRLSTVARPLQGRRVRTIEHVAPLESPTGDPADAGALPPWAAPTPQQHARRVRPKPVEFPHCAEGVPVHFLDPNAPWAHDLGVDRRSNQWEAGLVARVELQFRGVIEAVEEWEAVCWPLSVTFDPRRAITVDWDERDIAGSAPTRATVRRPEAPIEDPAWWQDVREKLQVHLDAQRTVDIYRNAAVEMVSRLGEDFAAFESRCRAAAEQRADVESAERSQAYVRKMHAWRRQLEATGYKIDEAEAHASAAMLDASRLAEQATLLAGTLKGQMRARDVAQAMKKRQAAQARLDRAQVARGRVDKAWAELAALDDQLGEELSEIHRVWVERAGDITRERVERQATVCIAHLGLLWMPVTAG